MRRPPEFLPVKGIEVEMASGREVVERNIISALARGLPEIEDLPGFGIRKESPIAIIGGGPSLHQTYRQLDNFSITMCAGSPHDWLVSRGVLPTYTLILDPDPVSATYLKMANYVSEYLVASQCDPSVFDRLGKTNVTLWHCNSVEPQWIVDAWKNAGMTLEQVQRKPLIGGGCTAGLRSITAAVAMGYWDIHLFGLDSCLRGDRHHAYDFIDPEREFLGEIVELRLAGSDRTFQCAKYMLAQLWDFQSMLGALGHLFRITVHGDGIIAELMRIAQREAKEKRAA